MGMGKDDTWVEAGEEMVHRYRTALPSARYVPCLTISTGDYLQTNLYIRGLPPDTTDESLRRMCEEYGVIASTKVFSYFAFILLILGDNG